MKKVLLLIAAFAFSFTIYAQDLCQFALGFQLNAGKGTCAATNSSCAPAGYIVDGRLTICFVTTAPLPAGPIEIRVQSATGAELGFTFCENLSARSTVGNRTCAEFCLYSTGENQPFNLGDGQALLVSFFGNPYCLIEKLTGQAQIPLPVDMKSFTASRSKSNVSVKWTTAAEWDNKGFYVQRNTRGTWENVAFVFSAAQDGHSSSDLSYSFNDLNNERGVSQYRILQVDIDGRSKASDIRSVRGEAMAAKLLVYPNPSMDGKISVVFEDGGNAARSVIVSDMSGRMIKQYRNVSTNNLSIEGLESGVYSIKVTDLSSAAVSVEKVIVKKR